VDDDTKSWMREMTDLAVQGSGEMNIYEESLLEVRPEWALPNRLLLGKVRAQNNSRTFHWFICGEVPLDYLPGEVAVTPREVLRHFSMKWQLDAERSDDETHSQELVENAEAVYDLADDERFWQA
jgi:hypothetical protein